MYPSTVHIADEPFASGQLADTTKVFDMSGAPLPCLVSLTSASTSRKIEVSIDNGVNYIEPPPDISTATVRALRISAPVSHVRLTGSIGDVYNIL